MSLCELGSVCIHVRRPSKAASYFELKSMDPFSQFS